MIWKSLKSGLARGWQTKRLVLVFYFASLLLGLTIALPLRSALSSFAGRSLAGDELASGITFSFIVELIEYNQAAVVSLWVPIVLGALVYWVGSLFLSGGALAVLVGDQSNTAYRTVTFWGSAANFFGRFLRLGLWSLLLLAALSLLPLAAAGIQRLAFGSDPYQYITYWGTWVKVGLAALALFFFRICFDYARIHAVLTDERRTRVSLWRGVRFATGHLYRTIGLALLITLAGAIGLALLRPVTSWLDGTTVVMVVMFILVQQLYVVWRVTLRLTRYASELQLYRALSEPAPVF
jgi:hypothetical protein